jgi:hypothetical protein
MIAKQIDGSYVASRKIKDWTLWRGRPPLKQKKNLLVLLALRRDGNVGAPATIGGGREGGGRERGRECEENLENLWMTVLYLDLLAR